MVKKAFYGMRQLVKRMGKKFDTDSLNLAEKGNCICIYFAEEAVWECVSSAAIN